MFTQGCRGAGSSRAAAMSGTCVCDLVRKQYRSIDSALMSSAVIWAPESPRTFRRSDAADAASCSAQACSLASASISLVFLSRLG